MAVTLSEFILMILLWYWKSLGSLCHLGDHLGFYNGMVTIHSFVTSVLFSDCFILVRVTGTLVARQKYTLDGMSVLHGAPYSTQRHSHLWEIYLSQFKQHHVLRRWWEMRTWRKPMQTWEENLKNAAHCSTFHIWSPLTMIKPEMFLW